ncbi:MAG: exo-alpha-sialidase [Fimbriimonadaceae bacterium]
MSLVGLALLMGQYGRASIGPQVKVVGNPADVFVSSRAGNRIGFPNVRIPGFVSLPDGKLVAVCEGRQDGYDENSNVILVSTSSDRGATWGDPIKIAGDGVDSYNSPLIVAVGSKILIHYTVFPKGTDSYSLAEGYEGKAQRSYYVSSDDRGAHWSSPVETTRSIRRVGVQSINFGPGSGLVLSRGDHAGRIIVPAYERIGGATASVAVFSDDGGKNWKVGNRVEAPADVFPNEVTMVEREDGGLLLNARAARNIGKRVQAVSKDGGLSWEGFRIVEELADPVCHAGMVRARFASGSRLGVVLLSMPGAMGRRNGLIRVSTDDGQTWPGSFNVTKDYFGYSVLVDLGGGELGLMYEGATGSASDPNTFIRFIRLKLVG